MSTYEIHSIIVFPDIKTLLGTLLTKSLILGGLSSNKKLCIFLSLEQGCRKSFTWPAVISFVAWHNHWRILIYRLHSGVKRNKNDKSIIRLTIRSHQRGYLHIFLPHIWIDSLDLSYSLLCDQLFWDPESRSHSQCCTDKRAMDRMTKKFVEILGWSWGIHQCVKHRLGRAAKLDMILRNIVYWVKGQYIYNVRQRSKYEWRESSFSVLYRRELHNQCNVLVMLNYWWVSWDCREKALKKRGLQDKWYHISGYTWIEWNNIVS